MDHMVFKKIFIYKKLKSKALSSSQTPLYTQTIKNRKTSATNCLSEVTQFLGMIQTCVIWSHYNSNFSLKIK